MIKVWQHNTARRVRAPARPYEHSTLISPSSRCDVLTAQGVLTGVWCSQCAELPCQHHTNNRMHPAWHNILFLTAPSGTNPQVATVPPPHLLTSCAIPPPQETSPPHGHRTAPRRDHATLSLKEAPPICNRWCQPWNETLPKNNSKADRPSQLEPTKTYVTVHRL